jgi:TRAP-type C4-dicarboxylate transport system permease small subunit
MLSALKRMGWSVSSGVSIAGLVALMFLAALTLVDGLMRAFFSHPLEGVRDVGGLAIAIGVTCCFPIALMERTNITVRFMATLFGMRVSRWCDLLASLLTGVVFFCLAWQFTHYAFTLAATKETTWILHIPAAPFWFGVAAVLWLSALIQCIVIIGDAARIKEPPEVEQT